MAIVTEYDSYIDIQDESGNVERHYPITKAKNVIGLDDEITPLTNEDIDKIDDTSVIDPALFPEDFAGSITNEEIDTLLLNE